MSVRIRSVNEKKVNELGILKAFANKSLLVSIDREVGT